MHLARVRHLWLPLIAGIAFLQYGWPGIKQRTKLDSLYRNQAWFELHHLVTPSSPAIYSVALAYGFHHFAEAERVARQLIESGPARDAAEARQLLCETYARQGRYAKALAEWQASRAVGVSLDGLEYLQAAGRHPDLEVTDRQPSALRAIDEDARFQIPVRVNGVPAAFDFDTGATESAITEAEAKRLGLTIEAAPGFVTHDSAGGVVPMGVAHVDDLRIGGFRLRHVLFYVAPDSRVPASFKYRGSIGFPILLAIETIRWRRDRVVEIGFPGNPFNPAEANLCLDGMRLLVDAQFGGARVRGMLDSGANLTHIFSPFEKDFPGARLQSGKGRYTHTGVGGTEDMPFVFVPRLTLKVGGMDVSLIKVPVLSRENTFRGDHLTVGFDVLNSASQATLDFRAMTLQLR